MVDFAHAEALTASDYIEIVLDKCKQNRVLALKIFKKLFQELPEQLAGIDAAIKKEDYPEAEKIAHKLHGSASFCGLIDVQEAAHRLERHLHNYRVQYLYQDFQHLQELVWLLTRYTETILDALHTHVVDSPPRGSPRSIR